MKSFVKYGTRPLPGGKFGIVVSVTVKGEWIETDYNKMPWPTEALALKRAKEIAGQRAQDYGIELPA